MTNNIAMQTAPLKTNSLEATTISQEENNYELINLVAFAILFGVAAAALTYLAFTHMVVAAAVGGASSLGAFLVAALARRYLIDYQPYKVEVAKPQENSDSSFATEILNRSGIAIAVVIEEKKERAGEIWEKRIFTIKTAKEQLPLGEIKLSSIDSAILIDKLTSEYPAYRYLDNAVAVYPDRAYRGVGKALVEIAVRESFSKGFKGRVKITPKGIAIGFLYKCGFRFNKSLILRGQDVNLDAILKMVSENPENPGIPDDYIDRNSGVVIIDDMGSNMALSKETRQEWSLHYDEVEDH